MEDVIKEIDYKGHKIQVFHDGDAESPREWENLGTMYCVHPRYRLGDKEELTKEDITVMVEDTLNNYSLPLYLYDHSGLAIQTDPFTCPWDSGLVGYIIASKDKVREEFKRKRLTSELRYKVVNILKTEVEIYNDFIQGNIYFYVISDDIGSCSGFYGNDFKENNLLESAKGEIDAHIKNNMPLFEATGVEV